MKYSALTSVLGFVTVSLVACSSSTDGTGGGAASTGGTAGASSSAAGGTAGASSGAGGTAGASAAAGGTAGASAAAGGTAGATAGAGGTAGASAAAGGTAGGTSAAGGTAGASAAAGGTAGASAAGGNPGSGGSQATTCKIGSDACTGDNTGCADTNCEDEIAACKADQDCKGANHDVGDCICAAQMGQQGTVQGCVDTFETGGGQLATDVVNCVKSKCSAVCGL